MCMPCGEQAYAIITSGTMSGVSQGDPSFMFDGVITSTTASPGAWTTADLTNWAQVTLTVPADDISGVIIFAGSTTLTSSSGYLSVYLSTTTNFTAGTLCAQGVAIIAGGKGAVTCPNATGVRYVTVQRNGQAASASDQLVIHELLVLTACEWC